MFGSLSIFMFVTLPSGRDKRVTLATIPCERVDCEDLFSKFVEDNGARLKSEIHAEFVAREMIRFYR